MENVNVMGVVYCGPMTLTVTGVGVSRKSVGIPEKTTLDPTTDRFIPDIVDVICAEAGAGLQPNFSSFEALYTSVAPKLALYPDTFENWNRAGST